MEQEGIVIEVEGAMAKVKASRHNSCESCGACPGNQAMVVDVLNPVAAQLGQRVSFHIPQHSMLKAAFVVYVLPLLAAMVGVALGLGIASYIHWLDAGGLMVCGGVALFALSIVYIRHYDRASRMGKNVPVITKVMS